MAIKRTALFGALALALVPAAFAPLPAAADVEVFLDFAPPPPRYEVVPAPRRGYAWQPGYWHWRNGRHVWVEGHWVRARPGYYWHPSRWEQRNGRWAFNPGGWHRDRYVEYRPRATATATATASRTATTATATTTACPTASTIVPTIRAGTEGVLRAAVQACHPDGGRVRWRSQEVSQ